MNLFTKTAAITALSATTAFAGNPLPAPADPTLTRDVQLVQMVPDCVSYLPNIVLWDHGTGRFVRAIQARTGLDRRPAAMIARRYCRGTRLGYPDPTAELHREIEGYKL